MFKKINFCENFTEVQKTPENQKTVLRKIFNTVIDFYYSV